ncbi:MAG: hypothetical protein Q4P06_08265 [Actinomycetaceae bacterium]|nr:hypothetical protein [Actinomycetaceae bacterium]
MNPAGANRFIHALNLIAEGVTLLGAAIEDTAWGSFEDHAGMSGVRPIAAAQLAQPALEDAEPPWDDSPKPAAASSVPQVSLEQVRAALADLSGKGRTAQVKALITQAGAEKLSDVDPAKYGWLLSQAEGLSDA